MSTLVSVDILTLRPADNNINNNVDIVVNNNNNNVAIVVNNNKDNERTFINQSVWIVVTAMNIQRDNLKLAMLKLRYIIHIQEAS